jgi:insulysin
MHELDFSFREEKSSSSYASMISSCLQKYNYKDVLKGPFTLDFDEVQIERILQSLSCDCFRAFLVANDIVTDLIEPYYGTEYSIQKLPEDVLNKLRNLDLCPDLHLPKPNEFIPQNLNVVRTDGPVLKEPNLVFDIPGCRMWHKKDDVFWFPKASVVLNLYSPLAYDSPLAVVQSQLLTELLSEALTEFSYLAEVAGLGYSLDFTARGFVLSIKGYNDKMYRFVSTLVQMIKTVEFDRSKFDILKERLLRRYASYRMESAQSHASHYLCKVLYDRFWSNDEKVIVANDVTFELIRSFKEKIFSSFSIEVLVHGNLTENEAIDILHVVRTAFTVDPMLYVAPINSFVLPIGRN